MHSSASVRKRFLDYFAKHDHKVVPSASLVPLGDPTLLFTNAGMNQFKDVFTGRQPRPYPRATTVQKCLRAGGKHNDLEAVGRTARHHTFFEMLGNFSFGDYFKEEAIRLGWNLLTKEYGIAADRLLVTVFGGDETMRLPADEEARTLWQKVAGVRPERILALGAKDNFWQMGETGPCGPCSEIHFHQGDDLPCSEPVCKGPACDCDRYLEVWNLVFMQFERDERGTLRPLPAPSVDTGMGLERLCAILQGKRSNYETDLFVPLIAEVEKRCKARFVPTDYAGESVSLRAIADHARATSFLIADGVMPEKTGREYVLRRIMRRAIYHGWLLGIREPFLHEVARKAIELQREVYPELAERQSTILEIVQMEERKFRETLERGVRILEEQFEKQKERVLPGELAFRLYDTYGFPLDLTEVIAERHRFTVETSAFETAMEAQRHRSTFAGSGEEALGAMFDQARAKLPPTEFLGYEATEAHGTVVAIFVGNAAAERASAGPVAFATNRTPFYGEQGGQVGDAGEASGKGDLRIRITDTQRPGGDLIVHIGEILSGELELGTQLSLAVDVTRRDAIRANHSATHLAHWALREVLGPHVAQKGSVVAPDRLRFDFSHTRPLTAEEKRQVEERVNQRIWQNAEVGTNRMALEEAKKSGAVAFFGEKYGAEVRVVAMAESKEFCGGTHVRRTGDIGLFKIVEETGIAQGVRRIVALTGPGALAYVQGMEGVLGQMSAELRTSPNELPDKIGKLREETRSLQKQIGELQRKLAQGGSSDLMDQVTDEGGVKVLAARTDVVDAKLLRDLGDGLRDRLRSGVVVLAGTDGGKVSLVAMVTKDLAERVSAGKIVGEIAPLVGGRGGGRADMAQAGGNNPAGIEAALARVREIVRLILPSVRKESGAR